jgi:hypothetical protein
MKNGLQQELYRLVDEILKDYFTHVRGLQVGHEQAKKERDSGNPNWIDWQRDRD